MNIRLGNLVAEITRRCNMKCPHCLRGNSQRIDMSHDIIYSITSQIDGISMVTFTGGEPSLNSNGIREFMYGFIYNDCPINGFWIATNARFYKEDFYNVLNSLYTICGDRESCVLTISGDQYHYRRSDRACEMYSELPFYSDERMKNIDAWAIVNDGMAKKNQFGEKNITPDMKIKEFYIYGDELFIDDVVYINAKGDVLLNCDLSYQKQKKYVIGNVLKESLKDILIRNLDEESLKGAEMCG